VSMEKKAKGEQFRVIDPAKVPTKPLNPTSAGFFAHPRFGSASRSLRTLEMMEHRTGAR